MKLPSPRSLCLTAVLVLVGCDAQRHLVGEGSGTGSGTGSGSKGSGGKGSDGTPDGGAVATGGNIGARDGGAGSGGGSDGGIALASGGSAASGGATGSGGQAGSPGGSGGLLPVSAQEAIFRTSQLLWQIAPDDTLSALANSGSLKTTADLRRQVARMLIDARAANGVRAFFRWWLQLDGVAQAMRDRALFPQFDSETIAAMAAEPETFGSYVTLDGDGLFSTLMTAPFAFVNEKLAAVYGLTGIAGTTLRRTATEPGMRAGLLTQPGLLTLSNPSSITHPSDRGAYLSDRILCRAVPLPPPSTPTSSTPATQPGTARERLQMEVREPSCAACHALIDPLGLAFERYDAIGQFRTTDNGLKIDPSGEYSTGDRVLKFNDAIALVGLLATEPRAQSCVSQRWMEFAVGRMLTEAESAANSDVFSLFAASGFNLRDLIAAVITSNLFLTHAPVCTTGSDQTCNLDLKISSLRGKCTGAGRCVCTAGQPDPATGRCP